MVVVVCVWVIGEVLVMLLLWFLIIVGFVLVEVVGRFGCVDGV